MIDPASLDWAKMGGLIPAIVQDRSAMIRMLGYMNCEALEVTLRTGLVTFYSRSKSRLWVKGETSGNRLRLCELSADCDGDALLVTADAEGPTCHFGTRSCFGQHPGPFFPKALEDIVELHARQDPSGSYTARLFEAGIKRIAQKVGEEGVETALAAMSGDADELIAEAADLTFHLMVLLKASGRNWAEVDVELERRHTASSATTSS